MTGEPSMSPYTPPRVASTLRSESMGALAVIVASAGFAAALEVGYLVQPHVLPGLWDRLAAHSDFAEALGVLAKWRFLEVIFVEIAFITLIGLIKRSHLRGRVLGATGFKFGPKAGLWIFVPVANLWMPYRVFAEYLRMAHFDPAHPRAWRNAPVPRSLPIWWSLVWGMAVAVILALLVPEAEPGTTIALYGAVASHSASVFLLAALVATMKLSAVLVALWQDRGAEADALLVEERKARRRARREKRHA